MQDYEKLGVFYLGKEYNLETRNPNQSLILYDSKDLVTHAVVLGMTGSGKTGLCVDLIEEAAIDGVPSIIIDPKGDLGNLLLTFPDLRGNDFLPWVNLDDARQKGISPEEFAEEQAIAWKNGLGEWAQSADRIQLLRNSADFKIYTPASNAGFSVSILKLFAAPSVEMLDDVELMRERVSTTVTGLLALLGIEADPVQSRDFILLSTIIDKVWRAGQDLDLAQLIHNVQNPPVARIGVLDLETFYPGKERFGLVMALNNLLASPGFSAWMDGESLDIRQILYTSQGKPRVAIFSIAHLNDAERMFFVTLLLNQVLGWLHGQSGTTSLRAILYMDEIFGYLPPQSNPPSKTPMLTLLKQARAYGLGLILATQNPVDLDYKALSNAGTWFIGRLQTERDKARVLDGLEGASSSTGATFDRQDFDRILSGLGSRVFLLHNTHANKPIVMMARWALSYLRGPLTREGIRSLMGPMKAQPMDGMEVVKGDRAGVSPAVAPQNNITEAPKTGPGPVVVVSQPGSKGPDTSGVGTHQPALPPEIPQVFFPVRSQAPAGNTLLYQPRLLGAARVTFTDAKTRINVVRPVQFLADITMSAVPVDWEKSTPANLDIAGLEQRPGTSPSGEVGFVSPPPAAGLVKNYLAWSRELANWLYVSQQLTLKQSPSLKMVSAPGEEEHEFRARIAQNAREQRDSAMDELTKKYAPKFAVLKERLLKAMQAAEREKEQERQQGMQAAISIGAALFGALGGRKSNIGRAATAARGVSRTVSQKNDVERANDTVEAVQKQIADLEAELRASTSELTARINPATEIFDPLLLRPKKADIVVQLVALAWVPFWQDSQGQFKQGW